MPYGVEGCIDITVGFADCQNELSHVKFDLFFNAEARSDLDLEACVHWTSFIIIICLLSTQLFHPH